MTNDDAYANAPHIPDGAAWPDRWAAAAESFRETVPPRVVRYGAAPRALLDLFQPPGEPKGLVVFVHGGFWRAFGRETWSHLAEGPLSHGWAVALPSYTLAPDARIAEITRQIACAVDAAAHEVPGPVRLAGHSAGGHLVARMLMADVTLDCAGRLDRCVPISPLSDLRPLIDTTMNADLRLDDDEARAESPALGPRSREVPTTVWVGADERPAFLDQARLLADAWSVELVVEPRRHHFDVVEGVARGDSPLTRAVLDGA